MKRLLIGMVSAALAAMAGSQTLPRPEPADTPDEQAVAFWVKFDDLPSVGEPTGLVGCRADKKGFVTVTWKALPTEIAGDLEMKSREAIADDEWHHIEVNFSMMQQRATFYLDGKFQWENDNLNVPHLARQRETGPSRDFEGAVKGLKTWNYAAESERMAIADKARVAAWFAAAKRDLAAAKTAAPKAKGLLGWVAAIEAQMAGVGEDSSVKAVKAICRDAAHARKIAEACDASERKADGARKGGPAETGLYEGAAVLVVPPFSQDPICPYDYPRYGTVASEARIIAAPDEYEAASFVLMAFRPLQVKAISCGGLKGPNGAQIPAANVDVKLVKRWYRSGSAWIAYHNDRRLRVLVPDLLVNDDSLIYVDEEQTRNYLRLDYPDGTIYSDVSDVGKNHFSWKPEIPFKDAATIQPFAIREAGRNQQLLATVHVPKDAKVGLYEGAVTLATDAGTIALKIACQVLPIALPVQPSPYGDTTRSYITHMNSFPAIEGFTQAERLAYVKGMLANIHAHNMNHTTGIWDTPTMAKLALEAGFVPDRLFTIKQPAWWWDLYPGIPHKDLSVADREAGIKAAVAQWQGTYDYLKGILPETAKGYAIGFSEATDYGSLNKRQGEMSDVCRLCGLRVFAHGMGDWNSEWAGDIQDMNSSTLISREEAARWHAAGGEVINYADPFPGAENPYWYRRKMGLQMYKTWLDGHMMHGFRQGRTPWNEWGEDWGGDGNYRNFCLCYPMQGGAIYKLCWDGIREGYDDLRYLTCLTALAQPHLEDPDIVLRREAKRAMLWIEAQDGIAADLDAVRVGAASRILTLQDAIARVKGGAK